MKEFPDPGMEAGIPNYEIKKGVAAPADGSAFAETPLTHRRHAKCGFHCLADPKPSGKPRLRFREPFHSQASL